MEHLIIPYEIKAFLTIHLSMIQFFDFIKEIYLFKAR